MKDIIDKAVKGGYIGDTLVKQFLNPDNTSCLVVAEVLISENFEKIIFSHDFLKGFFGEELTSDGSHNKYLVRNIAEDKDGLICPRWKYHAQQLVLSTDRKEYLKRFI